MLREKNALNLLQEHPAIYKILFRSYYYATLCHILLYQYMSKIERVFRRIFTNLILIVAMHYISRQSTRYYCS